MSNEHDKTITLHTYNDISEAEMIAAKLESRGIKTFVHDENVMGVDPVAGVKLKVFEKDVAEAEKIIKED
jgi:hypothetical protein